MIANDVITAVTEPTDWVNSIVCNIRETPEGQKKIRLCLDPRGLNQRIYQEYAYYTPTIDELLAQLHDNKFFSVVDMKKGIGMQPWTTSQACCVHLTPPSDGTVLNDYPSESSSRKISSNANSIRSTAISPT